MAPSLRTVTTAAVHAARTLGRGLLDVLYPPRCLSCGARPESPQLPLCPQCLQSLERAPDMGVAARLDRLPEASGVFDSPWPYGCSTRTARCRPSSTR
jgi:hypothetical protein